MIRKYAIDEPCTLDHRRSQQPSCMRGRALASFTRAAQALGTAQSLVSTRVKKLEENLGQLLLQRHPRLVRLTADGERFLPAARELMAAHERARDLLRRGSASASAIGISEQAVGADAPALLARLARARPRPGDRPAGSRPRQRSTPPSSSGRTRCRGDRAGSLTGPHRRGAAARRHRLVCGAPALAQARRSRCRSSASCRNAACAATPRTRSTGPACPGARPSSAAAWRRCWRLSKAGSASRHWRRGSRHAGPSILVRTGACQCSIPLRLSCAATSRRRAPTLSSGSWRRRFGRGENAVLGTVMLALVASIHVLTTALKERRRGWPGRVRP
jgi:DNA-binding transcriptional LysR family regulator